MKKILFLMAMLPMMMLTACSSDDDDNSDYESRLVGSWVEDTESTIEVFNLELKSDHTGIFWATDNGQVDSYGKRSLTWSATEYKFTGTYEGEGTEIFDYQLVNGKLYLGEIVYTRR